jgi:hypothetical protein
MAVIYPHFLRTILEVHDNIQNQMPYPFFDLACIRYEALRSVMLDGTNVQKTIDQYGLTEYAYRKCFSAFQEYGTAGLIGLDSYQLTEDLSLDVERMIFVLKKCRPWIPATKMVLIVRGFNHDVSLSLMRHLYASYGWAFGTKAYQDLDFHSLNQKVLNLCSLRTQSLPRESFFHKDDRLQILLEIFRTLGTRGITRRYPGSRVAYDQHKKNFRALGLLGLVDRARPPFRNSKLGFEEEGRIVLSKIQDPEKDHLYFLKLLTSKKIQVRSTCLINIFKRWDVDNFKSQFKGDLDRLVKPESTDIKADTSPARLELPKATPLRLDMSFITFITELNSRPIPLANPGIFLFLPYLNRLRIFEKTSSLMNLDSDHGYGWFSLLLLNLGRILGGLSSVSKACSVHELSIPLLAGLVAMPSKDSLLNGLATIKDDELLQLRRHLTQIANQQQLIEGKHIAFDFKMRDFAGDDVNLKNIGKGPSPKRKICFPGFRPHLAWDISTGTPISLEFRNGKARATTTIKRFIRELLSQALGKQAVEYVYLDSEYTAEHVWKFIVDPQEGLGAELTMCIKQNKRVKRIINSFLEADPTWIFFDEDHTYTEQTFEIPIRETNQVLRCVLKRKESNGKLRCFGSTIDGLDSKGILNEYRKRWAIENGIKDLVMNYFFDNIPGIDPHRINIHYFVVTLARTLYEMLSQDYEGARNPDKTKKSIATLRHEFIVGSNAVLSRQDDVLVVKWMDYYQEKQHKTLLNLFTKLNRCNGAGLPFLGGLKLRFQIAPPRPDSLRNQFKKTAVEF